MKENFTPLNIGDAVVRGKDWCWGPQDIDLEGNQMKGTVTRLYHNTLNVEVTWENGSWNNYRYNETYQDLQLVNKPISITEVV